MDLTVRPIVQADKADWRFLFDGYNAFYGRSGDTALASEIVETTWERFFDDDEPVFALVAGQEGKLVGLVQYLFHRSTTAIQPSCYLQDLFTLPEARGRGVGRALIQAVYEKARQDGAARVYWLTHETNVGARKLYDEVAENSGFIVYRKMMEG